MTAYVITLATSKNNVGKNSVILGNGASLPITHIGTLYPSPNIHLLDVLIVSYLTKNIFSIGKLTFNFSLSATFTNYCFTIQNKAIGHVVATR